MLYSKKMTRALAALCIGPMLIASLSSCSGAVDNKRSSSTSSASSKNSDAALLNLTSTDRKAVGSFIQPWYVKDWKESRWDQEFAEMKKAGFEFIILQSVVDLSYDTSDDYTAVYKQDYTKYPFKGTDSLYPTALKELKKVSNSNDSLENCFKSAKKNGMKVMVGPLSDERWWQVVGNMPEAPRHTKNLETGCYLAQWVNENGELSNKIAKEIYDKYIKRYPDQFYGWYYNNEMWNMAIVSQDSDTGITAKNLAKSMNISLDFYSTLTPGKPFMLSPYCDRSYTTAAEAQNQWTKIFSYTHFRNGDFFCPQDSIGGHADELPKLAEWMRAYKAAVDSKSGLKFWVNNENFTEDGKPAYMDRYIRQLAISAKFCEGNIVFSYNHYYCPIGRDAGYNITYLDFLKNKKLDSTPPEKPSLTYEKSGDTYVIDIKSKDNCAVAGYNIFKGSASKATETVSQEADDPFLDYTVREKGIYYVQAYDYAKNVSEKAKIEIK